ncbi:D-dopachrome decarboxylase-like [Branchiostoma floridae]|uniref:D-dopachrome decarboxylase n=1 Tax=Branchiostoma floridae TaxID=7739 RepID=A0A9J7LYT7_BRAFL|nr:D-dopachrome decarboxylase-like [Branchiostoma floridae]
MVWCVRICLQGHVRKEGQGSRSAQSSLLDQSSTHRAVLQCEHKNENMPLAHIKTNLSQDQISDDFMKETSQMITELLNAEEGRVVIHVDAGQRMLRAGSFDPYIQFEIADIKSFDDEADKEKYSKAFFDYLSEKLPVKYDRIVVIFHRLEPEDVAIKGTLISTLLKQ